jgi:hypothetical protein
MGIAQSLGPRRLGATIIVVGALLAFGAPATASSAAATKESGTLIASGAVRGRWTMKSCTVGATQGVFVLNLVYGPPKGYPALLIDARLAASTTPVVASRTVNLATTESDFITFYTSSKAAWAAGNNGYPHHGSGVLSTSTSATSGTLTAVAVAFASAPPVHLKVTWNHCRTVVMPHD